MMNLTRLLLIIALNLLFVQSTAKEDCDAKPLSYYQDPDCLECEKGKHQTEAGTECTEETCTTEKPVQDENGYCVACTDNSKASEDGQTCECNDYYYKDGDVCKQDKCLSDTIQTKEGKCESCDTYYHPDEAQRNCVQDDCDKETEIVGGGGKCVLCEEYTYPDDA